MTRRDRLPLLAGILLTVVGVLAVVLVLNLDRLTAPRPVDSTAVREAITAENLMGHLAELQRIADENGGNRQAGEPGDAASVDHVEQQLRAAGYETRRETVLYQRVGASGTTDVVTQNLFADLPGRSERTVVVGAHLDGVATGPGINDNGSGVAAVLETALQLAQADVQLDQTVRFAFWGGEEDGLHGSTQYVAGLDDAGRRNLTLYLNLDMVGSPNPTPRVYGGMGRPHRVERVLSEFLREQGVHPFTASFEGSDHQPFVAAGIPVGGLYTGASEGHTPADPCYHLACDRVDNIDPDMLDLMADALAHGVLTVAR